MSASASAGGPPNVQYANKVHVYLKAALKAACTLS